MFYDYFSWHYNKPYILHFVFMSRYASIIKASDWLYWLVNPGLHLLPLIAICLFLHARSQPK